MCILYYTLLLASKLARAGSFREWRRPRSLPTYITEWSGPRVLRLDYNVHNTARAPRTCVCIQGEEKRLASPSTSYERRAWRVAGGVGAKGASARARVNWNFINERRATFEWEEAAGPVVVVVVVSTPLWVGRAPATRPCPDRYPGQSRRRSTGSSRVCVSLTPPLPCTPHAPPGGRGQCALRPPATPRVAVPGVCIGAQTTVLRGRSFCTSSRALRRRCRRRETMSVGRHARENVGQRLVLLLLRGVYVYTPCRGRDVRGGAVRCARHSPSFSEPRFLSVKTNVSLPASSFRLVTYELCTRVCVCVC